MEGPCTFESWYALLIRRHFEKVVARHLQSKGYEQFLPLCPRSQGWLNRTFETDAPLFPEYLFCRFDVQDRLRILLVPGVMSVVGGNHPRPVAENELDNVRSVVQSGLAFEPYPFRYGGYKVRIEDGPLSGVEGMVVENRGSNRLVVSVNLLHRSIAVNIDSASFTPVPRAQGLENMPASITTAGSTTT